MSFWHNNYVRFFCAMCPLGSWSPKLENLSLLVLRLEYSRRNYQYHCCCRCVTSQQQQWYLAQSIGTEVWWFIYTYKTSYPTRRHACGGRAERPQIRPKSSRARFVEKRQWFWVRKLSINSNNVSSAGKRPGRLCQTLGPCGLREVISVCSVNIPKISSVVYHLLVFITAENRNMSNGQ